MIGRLTGHIEPISLDEVIVDVDGVGYQVNVPSGTVGRVPTDEEATLKIYTKVRDDAIELFGFASDSEKDLFEEIISISRMGPKLALSMLSAMSPAEIARNVNQSNTEAFKEISGIGKKTAKRLVLELADRIEDVDITQGATASLDTEQDQEMKDDLKSALKNLGYDSSTINSVIKNMHDEIEDASSLEPLVRKALELM